MFPQAMSIFVWVGWVGRYIRTFWHQESKGTIEVAVIVTQVVVHIEDRVLLLNSLEHDVLQQ
jgi:hypothetical protein